MRAKGLLQAAIVAVAMIGLVSVLTAANSTRVSPLCGKDVQEIARARELAQQGIEEALKASSQHLVLTWQRQNVEESQYAAAGVQNAFRIFFHAKHAIEALDIPLCKAR